MSAEEYQCFWWEKTDDDLVWEDGIGSPVYRNITTGVKTHRLPPGSLIVVPADFQYATGYDGLAVVCIVPRRAAGSKYGTMWWHIDGMASNCTKKDDSVHRCWVRHGSWGEPVHVDKNGCTCAAGAGSISVPGFHAFLHNNVLRSC